MLDWLEYIPSYAITSIIIIMLTVRFVNPLLQKLILSFYLG